MKANGGLCSTTVTEMQLKYDIRPHPQARLSFNVYVCTVWAMPTQGSEYMACIGIAMIACRDCRLFHCVYSTPIKTCTAPTLRGALC